MGQGLEASDVDGGATTSSVEQRLQRLERELADLRSGLLAGWRVELDRTREDFLAHLERALARSSSPSGSEVAGAADDLPAGFYSDLEARFRGSVEEISRRQAAYLDDLAAIAPGGDVIDLGCGRGEFLVLLRDHGIDGWGVDSSAENCETCRLEGLRVQRADLLDTVTAQPDGSVRALVALQVIEHLPFPKLLELMDEAARALKPGGLLLLETPNGANVSVAASTFWLDPTHVRPLHPLMLAFLAERAGLVVRELRATSRANPPWALPLDVGGEPEPSAVRRTVEGLQELLVGPQDITLLASRPD